MHRHRLCPNTKIMCWRIQNILAQVTLYHVKVNIFHVEMLMKMEDHRRGWVAWAVWGLRTVVRVGKSRLGWLAGKWFKFLCHFHGKNGHGNHSEGIKNTNSAVTTTLISLLVRAPISHSRYVNCGVMVKSHKQCQQKFKNTTVKERKVS